MESHGPNRKPNGIAKADREARKSDDLLKHNFTADKPLGKCVTDVTEIKVKNGKLYVPAMFDCCGLTAIVLSMDDNMRAELCAATVENAAAAYPEFSKAILHSDRGSQYTSELYRCSLNEFDVRQSMNSAGEQCHDNAQLEQLPDMFGNRWKASCRKAPQILFSHGLAPGTPYWNIDNTNPTVRPFCICRTTSRRLNA